MSGGIGKEIKVRVMISFGSSRSVRAGLASASELKA